MARKTLTDRLLRTLKTDAADAVVPGLAVRIGAAGQKTFVLVGRYPGRTNPTRRAIGTYPAISLEQARDTARDWIALVQRGIDPAVQVATEREANRVRAVQHLRGCRRVLPGKARCQPAHCTRHRPARPGQADLALARSADRHDRQARRDRHDRRRPGEVRRRHGPAVADLCAPSVWLGRGARSCPGQSMRRRRHRRFPATESQPRSGADGRRTGAGPEGNRG